MTVAEEGPEEIPRRQIGESKKIQNLGSKQVISQRKCDGTYFQPMIAAAGQQKQSGNIRLYMQYAILHIRLSSNGALLMTKEKLLYFD